MDFYPMTSQQATDEELVDRLDFLMKDFNCQNSSDETYQELASIMVDGLSTEPDWLSDYYNTGDECHHKIKHDCQFPQRFNQAWQRALVERGHQNCPIKPNKIIAMKIVYDIARKKCAIEGYKIGVENGIGIALGVVFFTLGLIWLIRGIIDRDWPGLLFGIIFLVWGLFIIWSIWNKYNKIVQGCYCV